MRLKDGSFKPPIHKECLSALVMAVNVQLGKVTSSEWYDQATNYTLVPDTFQELNENTK